MHMETGTTRRSFLVGTGVALGTAVGAVALPLLNELPVFQICQGPLDCPRRKSQFKGNGFDPRPADAGGVRAVPEVDVDRLFPVAQIFGVNKVEFAHLLSSVL